MPCRPHPSRRLIVIGEVNAGFPSPAEGFEDQDLDLHAHVVRTPAATYFFRAVGNAMRDEGVVDGALLVVDRSLAPAPGRLAVVNRDGEHTVMRLTQAPAEVFGMVVACVVRF